MCRSLPAKIVAVILVFSGAASLPAQPSWPTCRPAGSFSYLEDEGPIRCFALRSNVVLKARGDAVFIAFDQGATATHHLLGICGKTICFFTADAKDLHGLGEPGALPEVAIGQPVEITLRRDEWRMSAMCEGRILARAYDSEVFGGKIGTCAVPGAIANVRLQPTDRVYFADDFMRGSKESSEWQACFGEWRLAGIEDNRIDPQRSSNAFVYEGLPGDGRVAASVTGRWYWGGRKVEVASQTSGGRSGRIASVLEGGGQLSTGQMVTRRDGETGACPVQRRDRRDPPANPRGGLSLVSGICCRRWVRMDTSRRASIEQRCCEPPALSLDKGSQVSM